MEKKMKAKSIVIPSAVLLVVLSSAFSVAPVVAVTEKVRKEPFSMEVIPEIARIVGWMSSTYGEKETPRGIEWHLCGVAQFDVISIPTGECVGKGQDTFINHGLLVDGNEDVKMEENAVVNLLGPDMQGIEHRLKIIFVVQNGDVKVNVYIVPPLP